MEDRVFVVSEAKVQSVGQDCPCHRCYVASKAREILKVYLADSREGHL